MSPRNWRPHFLVFVSDMSKDLDLVRFGCWFSQKRGIVTACQLLMGDLFEEKRDLNQIRLEMQDFVNKEGMVVFSEVDVVPEIVDGIISVTQANGIAGIESNTILVGWPDDKERLSAFIKVMRRLEYLHKSFVIGRIKPRYIFRRESIRRTIHVWWGGLERNGDLLLLLAYLLTRNPEWRDADVQVMSIASNELMKERTERKLEQIVLQTRIETEVKVFMKPDDKSVQVIIHQESKDAEMVFFGLAATKKGEEEEYAERMEALAGDFPVVFFVKNSSIFTGDLLGGDAEDG